MLSVSSPPICDTGELKVEPVLGPCQYHLEFVVASSKNRTQCREIADDKVSVSLLEQ